MEVNLERLERSQVRIKYDLTAEDVNKYLEQTAKELSKSVKIPGFRPGHAPSRVIEARLGKKAFMQDAVKTFLPKLLTVTLTEEKIDFLNFLKYDYQLDDLDWGKSFAAQVTVDVKPEVKLATYKGVSAQKKLRPVTDEMIQHVLQQNLDRYSELVPSQKTKAEIGDYAIIDLEGKSGGEVVPGTVAEGYSVALGKGYLEEKLEAGIIGMEVGETKVISIEYPEDQPNSEIAGKTVNFTVKLTGIQEREYPELNDEFAQDVSGSETLEEWKEKIKADLEAKINSQAEDALQNELVDKVVQDSALELPRFTLEQYEILAEERMKMMLAYQGITWEGYAKFLEKDGKNQQQEIRSIAEKDLKEDFVLLALADAEKFEPSSEEIQATVKKLEQSASKDSKLSQDELVDRASAQLRSQKARQFIREHAVVEEVIEQQEDRSEKNEHTSTDGGGTD